MAASEAIRFTNVDVFDSVRGEVGGPFDVTVRGAQIEAVASASEISSADFDGASIDGTGKTLMPGLIDAHWHTAFTTVPAAVAAMGEAGSYSRRRSSAPGTRSCGGSPQFAILGARPSESSWPSTRVQSWARESNPRGRSSLRLADTVTSASPTRSRVASPGTSATANSSAQPSSRTARRRCCEVHERSCAAVRRSSN